MKNTVLTKVSTLVLSAAASLSFIAPSVGARTVIPPMHNANGTPVIIQRTVVNTVPFRVPYVLGSFNLGNAGSVNANISQATYYSGSRQVVFRKARGNTGLVANFPGTYHVNISGRSVVLKGTNQGYFTAQWSSGGYNYSISCNTPMNYAQMEFLVSHLTNS